MRILTITSNHPPCHSGGYELRVKDIMDGLFVRGHQVLVLSTSKTKSVTLGSHPSAYQVKRVLHDRNHVKFFPKEVLYDLIDTKVIEKTIKEFQPDVIYLGHTYILSKAILPNLASLAIPIVYDEGGTGLKGAWTENGRWFRFCGDYQSKWNVINKLKPWVIKFVLHLGKGRIQAAWRWPENMRVFFNSQNNLNHSLSFGVAVEGAKVIHSGIDLEKFEFRHRRQLASPIKIICPGRLDPRKGQLDAIAIISKLSEIGIKAELTLVGEVFMPGYLEQIREEINSGGLQETVKILGMVSQEELAKLYQQADICYFTSYHPTGFSRTPLEAMACGCIVISYGNEGSDEVIRHEENGFIVQDGNIDEVKGIIEHLIRLPQAVSKISLAARKEICTNFELSGYIKSIEKFILESVSTNEAI